MAKKHSFGPEIIDGHIEENMLTAKVKLAAIQEPVSLMIDPETVSTEPDDFAPLVEEAKKLVAYLDSGKYQEIVDAVAKEINESAYGQQDVPPSSDELTALINDLTLAGIEVFPEGFMLNFISEKIFPGSEIKVQLEEDFSIDDVSIYD
ncbi:hypothetical protein SAMN05660461_1859 [Chitinophaga ginsengisegetis]|uniref:Uncharacterized protein n=1 Tax=Chitinophaga ginsengisegetis TaxID=393003 RepID=A0A1T5NJN6_9BACT|nr:hypothetical protein [Chitinophaga ginsengisegetis]MDR6569814.1 hypothetical protein [Chitinophaga ginsengisegetis]MDR6649547.1 hypothetical protein [Chitinophaga ginsengisegetis]MDR6655897.1 hypothetical protein [Chitinophaga ginsengisegetis]SKD00547.1 hypothetical protein SAMN05660461_1859 [Chitinophaga ginsengisegetis]